MKEFNNQSKTDYVHSIFENIADDYDWMNWIISLGLHRFWRRKAVDWLQLESGAQILDVCCGTCDWTIQLAQQVGAAGRVVGLDFSTSMLQQGQLKVENQQLEQIKLIQGDARQLPMADNQFDYATIGFALRNVQNIKQVLAEMKRVVTSKGAVISLELLKPPRQLYRQLFLFYMQEIVPRLGQLCVNRYQEYAWLPKSIVEFPDSQELKQIFYQVGFNQVQLTTFAGGAVAVHQGK